MKKFGIIALAALLVVAFTVPASALENVFGGYWRTRMSTYKDFSGADTDTEKTIVDTRTRLYYTAVINDNLKFVNKFEFNSVWGDTNGGDIGADGTGHIRVKNSYADFNVGPVNAKVGIQSGTVARGFFMDDDFSGLIVTYKGEGFSIPFIWVKAFEGHNAGYGDFNDMDVDYYGLLPSFNLGDGISINPFIFWATSDDISAWVNTNGLYYHPLDSKVLGLTGALPLNTELDIWWYGLNADAKFGPLSLWFTGIYEDGEMAIPGATDVDIEAYLIAIGGAYDMGMFDIHGQYFYASGDDDWTDDELEAFWIPSQGDSQGQSYYWAEIMGFGIFDDSSPSNTPGDKITNVWAANLGTKIKPMDKLTVTVDLWYAELAEERATNVDETLGTELDVKVTYELVQGLNLDVVGAYLWADEGVYKQTAGNPSEENPYEVGARLSLSF
jgi:hypothetical protein